MHVVKKLAALTFCAALAVSCDPADTDDDTTSPPDDVDTDTPIDDDPEPGDGADDSDDFLADSDGRVFSYVPAGDLLPASGPGHTDTTIYRPDIVFPLEEAGFLNSQVYRHGGSQGSVNGMNGGQCDATNYDYPWQDTFCESRSRDQIMCPDGGHEGVDIRAATCIPETGGAHWAIAAEDGRIIAPSSSRYTVRLQANDGTLYRYMHLDMSDLAVADGEFVTKGQRIGKVSNDFFNSSGDPVPTTFHLHFEMYQNYAPDDETDPIFDQVNPYMTLVNAYEKRLRGEE